METAGRQTERYIESILLGMRPHRQFSPNEFSFSGLIDSALDQWRAEIPAGIDEKIAAKYREKASSNGEKRKPRI